MWTSCACANPIRSNPCQKLSRRRGNPPDRDPDLRRHSRNERPRRAAGREAPGTTNQPPLRRSSGCGEHLREAAMNKPKPSSILPDLLPVRELPKERERILGRDQHLQKAARERRTTPNDPRPLMERCRQSGTNDHVGPSEDPPGSASSLRWRKE